MGRHQAPHGVGAVAMPGSKKDKQEGRKAYTNTWAAGDIHKACCANPGFCCVALFWCVHRAPSRVDPPARSSFRREYSSIEVESAFRGAIARTRGALRPAATATSVGGI